MSWAYAARKVSISARTVRPTSATWLEAVDAAAGCAHCVNLGARTHSISWNTRDHVSALSPSSWITAAS